MHRDLLNQGVFLSMRRVTRRCICIRPSNAIVPMPRAKVPSIPARFCAADVVSNKSFEGTLADLEKDAAFSRDSELNTK